MRGPAGRVIRRTLPIVDDGPVLFHRHGDRPPYEEHLGPARPYLRDLILGVNDGLVSMFLLVAGVVGGSLSSVQVLLTGVAGALAGAVSMAAGEYLATKSQDEAFQAELELERIHLEHYRDQERRELRDMFAAMGLDGAELDTVVEIIDRNDTVMMNVMAGLEFGVVDSERRQPFLAAVFSGLLFVVGSLPSVVPFAIWDRPTTALAVAGAAAGVALFIVGGLKTLMTRRRILVSGLENLAIGFGGGIASYLVGRLFGATIGG